MNGLRLWRKEVHCCSVICERTSNISQDGRSRPSRSSSILICNYCPSEVVCILPSQDLKFSPGANVHLRTKSIPKLTPIPCVPAIIWYARARKKQEKLARRTLHRQWTIRRASYLGLRHVFSHFCPMLKAHQLLSSANLSPSFLQHLLLENFESFDHLFLSLRDWGAFRYLEIKDHLVFDFDLLEKWQSHIMICQSREQNMQTG